MFVVTFPKCGTTWTQHIGYLIFHKGVPPPSAIEFLKSRPFLKMLGADAIKAMKCPGLIKTHLPYDSMSQHAQAKYLYVCRNPKDACISFFHHTRAFAGYEFSDGRFEDFFEVFMEGKNEYEDYFEHVLYWYPHRNDPNVLFIHCEDMKNDPKKAVLEIAEFLDKDDHKLLVENEEMLRNLIEHNDITSMKVAEVENFVKFFANPLEEDDVPARLRAFHETAKRQPNAGFIRKGQAQHNFICSVRTVFAPVTRLGGLRSSHVIVDLPRAFTIPGARVVWMESAQRESSVWASAVHMVSFPAVVTQRASVGRPPDVCLPRRRSVWVNVRLKPYYAR
ncbi:hypothetical protein HPB47_007777 [Ixodes persulcatus]|uniref:Uncharacterized protein n=1 Tax=Ixodes persulcatus TaxID=34615 RepID=A0AC60P6J2_IXOPE|nr:hypothetical protein HPB47_007777 [Ixodes persulcatus]